MLNTALNLNNKLFEKDPPVKSLRLAFGEALAETIDPNIVLLTADLKESTYAHLFADKYPERFFDTGVSEQALATVASGLANYGKIPFITSYAVFSPGRNWEQIRTTICLNNLPVKIIGSHAGLNTGPDGATHQALEDLALMTVLPNMVVYSPPDYEMTKKIVSEAISNNSPTYIRLPRESFPEITTLNTSYEDMQTFWQGKDPKVAIISTGTMVYYSLLAAMDLEKVGIDTSVISVNEIKPLDSIKIIALAHETGAIVTVEEHQVTQGMGTLIAKTITENYPVPMEFVGMEDKFGESGNGFEVMNKYKLNKEGIVEKVKKVLSRKDQIG